MSVAGAPCLDCPERTIGCHSKCKQYQTWKTRHDDLKHKEQLRNNSILYSSRITLGDARLSYQHFDATGPSHATYKNKMHR